MRKRPQWGRIRKIESLSQAPVKQTFILRSSKGTIHQSAHQPTRPHLRTRLPTETLEMAALEEELRVMGEKHSVQMGRLNQVRERRQWQLRDVMEHQRTTKMEIWELRNEALELREAIQMEKEEMEQLQALLPLPHPQQEQPLP